MQWLLGLFSQIHIPAIRAITANIARTWGGANQALANNLGFGELNAQVANTLNAWFPQLRVDAAAAGRIMAVAGGLGGGLLALSLLALACAPQDGQGSSVTGQGQTNDPQAAQKVADALDNAGASAEGSSVKADDEAAN